MREISKDKLRQAAKFLDEKPKALSSAACKDEYWRQLINALPQRIYTNSQIEGFAEEILTPRGSPALKLLVDLRERGLEYEAFLDCLEKIKCYNALNLFIQSSKSVCVCVYNIINIIEYSGNSGLVPDIQCKSIENLK